MSTSSLFSGTQASLSKGKNPLDEEEEIANAADAAPFEPKHAQCEEVLLCGSLLLLAAEEDAGKEKTLSIERSFFHGTRRANKVMCYYIDAHRRIQIVPRGLSLDFIRIAYDYVKSSDRVNKIIECLLKGPLATYPATIVRKTAYIIGACSATLDVRPKLVDALVLGYRKGVVNAKYVAPADRTEGDELSPARTKKWRLEPGCGYLDFDQASDPACYSILFSVTLVAAALDTFKATALPGCVNPADIEAANSKAFENSLRSLFPLHSILCKATPLSEELANRMASTYAKQGNFGIDCAPTLIHEYARHLNFLDTMNQQAYDRSRDPDNLLSNIPVKYMNEARMTFADAPGTPPSKKEKSEAATTGKVRPRNDSEEVVIGPKPPANGAKKKKNEDFGVFLTKENEDLYNGLTKDDESLTTEMRQLVWKHAKLLKALPKLNAEKALKVQEVKDIVAKVKSGALKKE